MRELLAIPAATEPAARRSSARAEGRRLPKGGKAQPGIRQLQVLRFVLAWAELDQDELSENWKRARAGETLRPIEPLR